MRSADDRVHSDLTRLSVDEINERMRRGVERALAEHKAAGRAVVVWDAIRSEPVELPADEIPVSQGGDAATPEPIGVGTEHAVSIPASTAH